MNSTSSTIWAPVDLDDTVIRRGMEELAAWLANRTRTGARLVGWKVGWNDLDFRRRMGVSTGVVGVLLDSSMASSEASLPIGGASQLGVELELAYRLGPRAASGWTVAAVAPAIELLDVAETDPARVIGTNLWHRAAVIGNAVPWRSRLLRGLSIETKVNGRSGPSTVATATRLDAAGVIDFVASGASAVGERLQEGQWILGGQLARELLWLTAGFCISASFAGLGDVTVSVTHGEK